MPVRIKLLRYVWETGWSGARSVRPWPDGAFTEIFRGDNGWSVRDFWLRATRGRVDLEFDIAPWGILYGQSHAALREDRAAILGACRGQARSDGLPMTGFDHVIAFVHEPPANTGIAGRDAVLDQNAVRLERYYKEVGRLLGFGHGPGVRCVMGASAPAGGGVAVLPGVELWHGDPQLCAECSVRRPRRPS
jgi:hypothetical protein